MAEARMHFIQAVPERYRPDRAVDGVNRRDVAELAYLLSERRGFAPGHELEDWLAAEREIDNCPVAEA